MIKIKGLKKKFRSKMALQGIDLEIPKGSLFGLVGPNGAGKTTMIKIMCGLLVPDGGEILINGQKQEDCRFNQMIGYMPDTFGTYDNLTVQEYMSFYTASYKIYGLQGRKRIEELLDKLGMMDKLDFKVDMLSRGMQQKLSLARALIHSPSFIIMDEPTNGLDPRSRFEFRTTIKGLCEEGKTVLVSSHILTELSEMCTDVGIIENGKKVISGSIHTVLERIDRSNPIRIKVLDAVSTARAILGEDPKVKSIARSEQTFMIGYTGNQIDEATLLAKLIASEVPVLEFTRETATLESLFMQITDHKEERVVLSSEFESDF